MSTKGRARADDPDRSHRADTRPSILRGWFTPRRDGRRTAVLRRLKPGSTSAARLLLLACGLYGNVIRLLPPLTASDEELERGLGLLEEALGDAGADRD